jgi:hypothetical protein
MYFLGWIFGGFFIGLIARAAHDAASIPWSGPFASVTRARWTLGVSLFALLCFAGLAAAIEGAWFPKAFWSIYSVLVASRVIGVFSGFLIGAFLVRSIALSNFISGAPSLPWWGFPAGVALLIIAGLILLARPDFLDSLQSFKAAGIEATFAARSSNLREVELNLNDVSQKLTLEDHQNFADDFIEGKSAIGKATAWFDKSPVKAERIEILKLIFNNYINPVVVSLSCLNKDEALEAAKHDVSLVNFTTSWQHFLLQLNEVPPTADVFRDFFERAASESAEFVDHVRSLDKPCVTSGGDVHPDAASDAQAVWGWFDSAVRKVRANGEYNDDPALYALTIMDPYVVGTAGDLIAFMFGQREKADFLGRIAEKFPRTETLLQTGIVNLFYQLADAKIKSEGSWPIDDVPEGLDYALRGADFFVSQSVARIAANPEEQASADSIFDRYSQNVFLILSQNLAVYNQRALRGEPIGDAHLRRWTLLLSRLLAISHARSDDIGPSEDIFTTVLDTKSVVRWPSIVIEEKYLVDADIAIALSLVLLHSGQPGPSASQCASARFYLKAAGESVDTLFKSKTVDYASKARLDQFIILVGYRVGSHCAQH